MSDDPRELFAQRWREHQATRGDDSANLDATMRPAEIATAETLISAGPAADEAWQHPSLPRIAIAERPADVAKSEAVPGRSGADFAVVSVLGEGGMGRVHLARQRSLDRDVALKSLRAEVSDATSAAALLHEARITGALEHPGIVPVHALGIDERGYPLLVMKRIDGASWRDLLRDPKHSAWERVKSNGSLSQADFHLDVLASVCNALHFAHARGVVHRDVKPDNVMVGYFGEVYLVDWGIAVRASEAAAARQAGPAGTPAYMAPEMFLSTHGALDARTDVYLLGATLHELLMGTVRHAGASIGEVIEQAYLSEPIAYPADVPDELAQLANRATSRGPAARPQSALEFRNALLEYARHRGSVTLTATAEAKCRELGALFASERVEDAARAAGVASDARFAYAQALAEWSGNAHARDGLEALLERLAMRAIAQRNAAGARSLIDEMLAPPEALRSALATLERALHDEHAKASRLDAMVHDLDESVGARARVWALLGIASLAVAISTWIALRPGRVVTPLMLMRFGLVVAAAIGAATVAFWRQLTANELSRRLVTLMNVFVVAMLAHRVIGWIASTPPRETLRDDLFIGTCLMASASAMRVRGGFAMTVVLAIGTICGLLWPSQLFAIFPVATVGALLTITFAWLRASRNPDWLRSRHE